MSRSWTVAGLGRCGLQMARTMRAAGIRLLGVVTRSETTADRARRLLPGVPLLRQTDRLPTEGVLLLAVGDDDIEPLAAALAESCSQLPTLALHTSGVHPANQLRALQARGVHVGSLHPLVSFPSADGPLTPLAGVVAAIEGQPAALVAATELARALEMRPVRVAAAAKPLYHAAAALAGNLTHVVIRLALEQLVDAGFTAKEASAALKPLVGGSARSALESRDWSRLTGALVRGDVATVRAHLQALPEDVASVYRALSTIAISRLETAENADRSSLDALRGALTTDTLCASVPVMRRREDS